MQDETPKHQRRVRYKGTHPKAYKEKYKELQPERYSDDVTKVLERGQTPAGTHRSICVKEIMAFLDVQPGQTGMDATLGYGGHSLEILKCLQPGGRLFATDVDPYELPRTQHRLAEQGFGDDILFVRRMNFSNINQIVDEAGMLDFVLADLGVSSMQIDNPERGFTFKADGPLDLRLNPTAGQSASAFLQMVEIDELEDVFTENADEPLAYVIAQAIKAHYAQGLTIDTTKQLQECIVEAIQRHGVTNKDEQKKCCQRCFQAIRIAVNNEFEVLEKFLEKLPYSLAPGGKVAILTFHSGEDRRVKKSFQYLNRLGIYSSVAPDPVRPSAEECFSNPRAKSAKLRWAVRSSFEL